MKYIPFLQFGQFLFSQSFEEIKAKIGAYSHVTISHMTELAKQYPSIYIQDIDLLIIFNENGDQVRFAETTTDITLEGHNLHTQSIADVMAHFGQYDEDILLNEEGSVESAKYGFIVSKDSEKIGNEVLIGSKSYFDDEEITPDDIIKFYLK